MRALAPVPHSSIYQPAHRLGPRGKLAWVSLEKLEVDESYQREIASGGVRNVQRILANFQWRKFAPVIVTPMAGDKYAIVDGQHRATAAFMHPDIAEVPCLIIEVSPAEAAECFAAINGQVTKLSIGQIYRARVVAKEPRALEIQEALDCADVRVLKYKFPTQEYEVGDTLAIGAIEKCYKLYGRDTLITALQTITQTADGNPGCVTAPLIKALCAVLAEIGTWRDAGEKLLKAMDKIVLIDLIDATAAEAKTLKVAVHTVLKRRIALHLVSEMGKAQPVEALARKAKVA